MPQTLLEIWLNTWLPVAGIALGIAVVLAAVVYMFGALLMNDRMKTWAKLEIFEILYSALIISLVVAPTGFSAVEIIDSAVQGALLPTYGPNGPLVFVHEVGKSEYLCADGIASHPDSIYNNIPACHIRLGIWYLHSIFRETSDIAFKNYVVYIFTSMASDFAINLEFITEAPGFFTFTPWRGFFTMGNTIKSMVFDYSIKIMMLTKFQEVFLSFMAKAAFPGIFVVGVVLRTFTFTRKLGGLLMAIALSLYYIFPAFYAFGGLVVYELKQDIKGDAGFKNICSDLGKYACEDPPVSNAMYMKGEIPMPGGNMKTSDVMDKYAEYGAQGFGQTGMSKRMAKMEQKDSEVSPIKNLDLSKTMTADKRDEDREKAKNTTDVWFKKVSSKSKFDSGVFIAFKPGGPVDALGRLAFFSVFFSLFGILGTIAAIRSLSVTFGGDIEIAGLTHLI